MKVCPSAQERCNEDGSLAGGAEEQNGAGLSDDTVQAARVLDQVLANLTESFSEGSDYLKVGVPLLQWEDHILTACDCALSAFAYNVCMLFSTAARADVSEPIGFRHRRGPD